MFHNGTEVDLYYRDADNGIHESVYSDATGWSAPFELPGTAGVTTSAPAADVFRNGTEVDVYYRTGDGGIGESAYSDANGWSTPLTVPGTAGVVASAPAADVFRNGTEVDLYYRTSDSGIGESVYSDATSWSSPVELPGTSGSAATGPGVDVFRNGTEVDLYYQAANDALRELSYSDTAGWRGPIDLGGAARRSPGDTGRAGPHHHSPASVRASRASARARDGHDQMDMDSPWHTHGQRQGPPLPQAARWRCAAPRGLPRVASSASDARACLACGGGWSGRCIAPAIA